MNCDINTAATTLAVQHSRLHDPKAVTSAYTNKVHAVKVIASKQIFQTREQVEATMKTCIDRTLLFQRDFLNEFLKEPTNADLVTVYSYSFNNGHRHARGSALIPNRLKNECLSHWTWENPDGHPGTSSSWKTGKKSVEYLRFGDNAGYEPLLIHREFHGMRPNYIEISEEFRLFHRLYHDRNKEQFFKIDDSGFEHLVAEIKSDVVRIRLLELRQFLAIKEMYLSFQIDSVITTAATLRDLQLTKKDGWQTNTDLSNIELHIGEINELGNSKVVSRLVGKRLICPVKKEQSEFFSFADSPSEDQRATEFIIGLDDSGREICHPADNRRLANEYSKPDSKFPHWMTPVFFEKKVLDKYFLEPSKYTVEDRRLTCGFLWGVNLDNVHDDHVCVFLGDLEHLPAREQLHWRAHNIYPQGTISETFFRQQVLNQWVSSTQIDHVFIREYHALQSLCTISLGWQILRVPKESDEHILSGLRIPAVNEQKQFDEQVLGLTKLLVDSLNESELKKLVPRETKNGIERLEAFLDARKVSDSKRQILFLKNLQELRSKCAAHRKGSEFRKSVEKFGNHSELRQTFEEILKRGVEFLLFLNNAIANNHIQTISVNEQQSE